MTLRPACQRWRALRHALDPLALPLGLLGLGAAVACNWRRWQQDRELLAYIQEPPPRLPLWRWPALPRVSVLVAAWNEADFIERHIESFLALRYPHKELVLCAGGRDGTLALARRYEGPQVKVLPQRPGEGKQRALARSFPYTQGEIIFLSDADCLLDDDAFERTLYPVATGREQVCTGGSRPLRTQLANPFVLSQAATQLYSSAHAPSCAAGLLGCNCAVARSLLARSGALAAEVATGTDYVTAKMLAAAGARIRHVPHSRVPTNYPATIACYLRQQRRWLRNVALHGRRFGANAELLASLHTSAVGLAMLVGPLAALFLGPAVVAAWFGLLAFAFLSRLRYLRFAQELLGVTPARRQALAQLWLLFLDFVAWVQPLPDYLVRAGREEW